MLDGVLDSFGGISEHQKADLRARSETFARGVEKDAANHRALELAELVGEISHRGEEESAACRNILEGFAGYLRDRPHPEDEAGEMW